MENKSESARARYGYIFKVSIWGRDGFFTRMKCVFYYVNNSKMYLYDIRNEQLKLIGIIVLDNINAISIEEIEVGNDE